MEKRIPAHISIIMDGNGRWAKEKGHERGYGHIHGVESVRKVTQACVEEGVKYLSVYAFSEENWSRPAEEVGFLMNLMMDAISREVETLMKNGVRFRVLGNMERIPSTLQDAIRALEEQTAGNDRLTLIVFLSYSGQWDILQAAKKMAMEHGTDVSGVTSEDFGRYLVTAGIPDPDLIIRTSGEQRLSNYLLWQGAYSELYFTDILWPDFGGKELHDAVEAYSQRDRRFGGLSKKEAGDNQ